MRNLKRALSLTLASIMLLGMMVVGSGAASYKDVTDDHNVEAIEVLQAVGIMVGDDGNFNPDKNVTRNEMAVIMSNLMDYRVASYSGTSPFTDVPSWAEPYVAACYTNGITSGTSATTYNGNGNVTTAQAALMIMKALGYFQYSADFGDDWQLAATRQANSIDLLIDVKSGVKEAMTRNDVAQLVLNGLETGMVEADDSSKVEVSTGDMQVSVGGTKYVYVTSREKYAVAIRDRETLQYGATSTAALSAPIVELGEKLYQGDLIKKAWEAGNTDDFGRPANTWTYQAKDIGSYAEEVEAGRTFTAKVTPKKLYNAVGKTAAEKYDWTVYENGERIYTEKDGFDALVKNQTNDSADFYRNTVGGDRNRTGNGVLTEVYVDGTNETVTVALTYYYPAEIYRVNSSDGKIILNSLESGIWGPATTSEEFEATGFEEDEIVYYTYANSKIQSVAKAERIEGDVTKVVAVTDDDDGSNFSLGEDTYKYNMTMKSNKLITENVDNNMAGYIDANGYVVYIDKAAVTYDYAYVLSIGTDGDKADSSGTNSTVYARLLLTDGSVITVETDAKAKDVEDEKFLNHIVSYSKNSANVYTLALKDSAAASASVSGTNGVKPVNSTGDIFENGKSPVTTLVTGQPSYIANSNTVFLAVDTNNSDYFSDWTYNTYTGIKNIPDIKATKDTKICVAATDKSVAKVVYVQNADVSGNGDAIFVVANGDNDLTLSSGSTKYYELNAYVNGEKTTIKVKKDSKADDILIHGAKDNFNPETGTYKDIAVNTSGAKYVVAVRTMSIDNDGLVTSVRLHDKYGSSAGTSGAKALAGTQTGRDRTTGNEVIYLGKNWARSWADGAKMVQYSVKNDAWTENIRISNTSVKDDTNDQWVAIFDDGEVIGLFIKDNPAGETSGGQTGGSGNISMGDKTAVMDKDCTSVINTNRLGQVSIGLNFKAPDWAKGANEAADVLKYTVTVSDDKGVVATLNQTSFTTTKTGDVYSATLSATLTTLENAINNGKIDAEQLKAEVTGVTWKYAAVEYQYADKTVVPDARLGGTPAKKLEVDSTANKTFTFTFTKDSTQTVAKDAKWTIDGVNVASGTEKSGTLASGTAVTFSGNIAAAGGEKVIVTLSGVSKAETATHSVESNTKGVKALEFYLITKASVEDGKAPAHGSAAEIEALTGTWTTSVPEASEGDTILIRAAGKLAGSTGIQATNIFDKATLSQATSVSPTEIGSGDGYWKITMGKQDLIIKDVAVTAAVIEKISIAPNGKQVNVKLSNGSFAADTVNGLTADRVRCQAVVDYINNQMKSSGWTAAMDGADASGDCVGITITNSKGTSKVAKAAVVVSTTEVTVDGTSYVMNAALGTLTLKDALEVAGKTITGAGANVFVIANKNNVGTYTSGTNIVDMATDSTGMSAAVASGVNEILTNSGKGYAKMAMTGTPVVTAGGTGIGTTTMTATIKTPDAATAARVNNGTTDLCAIGVEFTIEGTFATAAIAADTATKGLKIADDGSDTSIARTVADSQEVKANAAVAIGDKLTVKVTLGAPAGAACKIALKLVDVAS